MHCSHRYRARRRRLVLGLGAVLLGVPACGSKSLTITGPGSRSVAVARGAEFTVVLQTVGPGEYQSPPTLSSGALQFLGVRQAALTVPAGPTQEFRFRAVARGETVIAFQHTGENPRVVDTVFVR